MSSAEDVAARMRARVPFRNSTGSLFGAWYGEDAYSIYSYGTHWPLAVWNGSGWIMNKSPCTKTTAKHKAQVLNALFLGPAYRGEYTDTMQKIAEVVRGAAGY